MPLKMVVPNLGDKGLAKLQQAAPEVEFLVAKSKENALVFAPQAHATYTFCTPEFIDAAPNLQWIQALSAGVERYPFEKIRSRGITLTNASGVYGSHLADHLMAFILAFSRQLPFLYRAQLQSRWENRTNYPSGDLDGQTLLVDGLGGTGQHLARRAAAFGMRVIATRRHLDHPKPDTVESVHPHDQLHTLLPEADWIAVCTPLTAETRNRYCDREFELMKSTACITNIARGAIINTDALVRALDTNQIGGAGLDVTDPEPLPSDHPLWQYNNVIITPHASGHSPYASDRILDFICENVRLFVRGEPLKNIVNMELEY